MSFKMPQAYVTLSWVADDMDAIEVIRDGDQITVRDKRGDERDESYSLDEADLLGRMLITAAGCTLPEVASA